MLEKLLEIHPVILSLFATLFTYFVTALGSGLVFFFKSINAKILNLMLGFAAGVMIAASYWSLLAPAIEMSEQIGGIKWLPAVIGFLAGAGFLFAVDRTLPHLHLGNDITQAEGIKTSWQRSVLLVLAITLHNIPEGLAVGVAFGALFNTPDIATLVGGLSLALGIGLQNFPEGAAVSIPLRREGLSRLKAFYYGQLSGIVEPIAGVIGAYLVFLVKPLLPYALAFAAGAMIYVAVEELIPESQKEDVNDFSTIGTIIGFAIMMFLDVALG
ncbi:MAG TPA: ZIP family metal transporter [Ignavibacteriales bacterium]|nr:ZIP family metal transporter [Ignavibacteriales bacterium]HOL81488.1 ZIP family metal transporter [Ignavibacteriales bacterium]HOM65386.1 ZIP family metal transporter [Ignavibacteriales bacterium]HPD67015.1 ZIP family metal transporter [Ignavibacteriales bacterium]HPP33585.1 ZIP family metal transporter [Ignavibacteriales bacterium]